MNHVRLGMLACAFLIPQAAGLYANEDEIRSTIKAYADAFNEKDFEKATAMWAEDASYENLQTGEATVGRAAIAADLKLAFETRPAERLMGRVDSIDLITPEVARVQGETTLSSPGVQPEVSGFSGILIKKDDQWLIRSINELFPAVPASATDALSELEWMLGSWEDAADGERIISKIQWSPNEAFMIRSTFVQSEESVTKQGTQIIGWDPRSLQIRSWTFNSDGTFGDALWSKNGDDWLVKASQTLEGGQAASGTFVITSVDDETVSVRLIGHEIEGEPQPASEPILMKRVAETNGEVKEETVPATDNSVGAVR